MLHYWGKGGGSKETEIDPSVVPVLIKTRVLIEPESIRMFKDKKTIFLKYPGSKDHFGYLLQPVEIVWRISKNNIILRCTGPEKGLDINMNRPDNGYPQFFYYFFYSDNMPEVLLDKMNTFCSPGGKLKTDAPCTGEKIQYT